MTPRRLQFGLTHQERRQVGQRRRERNCIFVIAALVIICGWIAAN